MHGGEQKYVKKFWSETLKLRVKFEDLGVGGGGWY